MCGTMERGRVYEWGSLMHSEYRCFCCYLEIICICYCLGLKFLDCENVGRVARAIGPVAVKGDITKPTRYPPAAAALVCFSTSRPHKPPNHTYPPQPQHKAMLFFSFFKTLVDHEVTIELKNDLCITGTLKSVDQFLNIKLDEIRVKDEGRYPHLAAVKNVFIRGSVVRYVHLPANAVDTALLEDATRREAANAAGQGKR